LSRAFCTQGKLCGIYEKGEEWRWRGGDGIPRPVERRGMMDHRKAVDIREDMVYYHPQWIGLSLYRDIPEDMH
jgi:hypothetical protein